MTYSVNKTACRDDALVLACATGEVVATTLYGGHHADVNATRCSHVPGDSQAPIKGLRISHWAKCLWKKSKCTIRLPLGGVFLYWPCGRHATIHYLIAEDFKCVSSKYKHYFSIPSPYLTCSPLCADLCNRVKGVHFHYLPLDLEFREMTGDLTWT